ncbi:MAG: hypothetical protein H7330_07685 [Hymenobacteraceae bacterium]|nr:hypothetical protein [Hymenobacteraceae bacterium]
MGPTSLLAALEEVLDLYEQPPQSPQPQRVRLCFDERPCQLLDLLYLPMPPAAGQAARTDCEYVRGGTACVLLAYDLDTGQRYVQCATRAPRPTTPTSLTGCRRPTISTPRASTWCRIISVPTPTAPFMTTCRSNAPGSYARSCTFTFPPKHTSALHMAGMEYNFLLIRALLTIMFPHGLRAPAAPAP